MSVAPIVKVRDVLLLEQLQAPQFADAQPTVDLFQR
jgi:hypothetical protein